VRSFDSHLAGSGRALCRLCVPLMDNGIDNASGKKPIMSRDKPEFIKFYEGILEAPGCLRPPFTASASVSKIQSLICTI